MADRHALLLSWGDGNEQTVQRAQEVIVDINRKRNTYIAQHTYNQAGRYTLFMSDPHRTAGIKNITNSHNESFYIESILLLSDDPSESNNSSASLTHPLFVAPPNKTYRVSLGIYDSDGDILTHRLISPKGENGNDVAQYIELDDASVTPFGGEFIWMTGQRSGLYSFSIETTEYRDGELIGRVIRDFMVLVDNISCIGNFTPGNSLSANADGQLEIKSTAGDSVNFVLTYDLAVPAATRTMLEIFAEDTVLVGSITVDTSASTSSQAVIDVKWQTTALDARCAGYPFVVRVSTSLGGVDYADDISVMVYLEEQTSTVCQDARNAAFQSTPSEDATAQIDDIFKVWPNPAQNVVYIQADLIPKGSRIRLCSLSGLILNEIDAALQTRISLHNVPAGMYSLQVITPSGATQDLRLIVQHQ